MAEPFKDWPRFDGAAAWKQLSPDQQARIGAAALEYVCALQGIGLDDAQRRRPFEAAARLALGEMCDGVRMRPIVLSAGPDAPMPLPSLVGRVCRACGCSDDDSCGGSCHWAERDLCNVCVEEAS
jgi:hypothetical protein